MTKITKHKSFTLLFIIIVSFSTGYLLGYSNIYTKIHTNITTNQQISQQTYQILRIIDGDTIVINYYGLEEKVRLLMIDTPESVHPDDNKNTSFGAIASDYMKSLLENKSVSLELDKKQRDRYGRLLAYVYCDGVFINELLVRNGYAKVVIYEPNHKYKDILYNAQDKAKLENKGIWAE